MPSAVPFVNRRDVLGGGVALAALAAVATACGKPAPKPPPVEQLLGPLDQARHDSTLAGAAATAVGNPPQVAAALTVVANQRASHARALSAEISRAAGKLATSPTSSSSETPGPSPAQPAGPPPPPPPVSDVIGALQASADSASRLVGTESGYRAGLLASIAASCTASYTVALVPGGPSI
ncbi:hypothetical protein [Mycobacterium sp. 94-17]|uniref:hypothetical protein n=1 Tax=Mycobacterium sp. 94-17 TaxID=2986147 RepID=UPI002D1F5D0C|nr:hypothetical protein [Mycobacterium sp. 94-17]MEB4208671.1 hypothetical protein [Mycobacterium sp. 94-17]